MLKLVKLCPIPKQLDATLDGEFVGVTPIELKVSRRVSHELVLRFGQNTKTIMLEPRIGNASLAVDAIPAATSIILVGTAEPCECEGGAWFCSEELCRDLNTATLLTGIGSSLLFVTIDAATGAINTLNPGEVFETFDVTQP